MCTLYYLVHTFFRVVLIRVGARQKKNQNQKIRRIHQKPCEQKKTHTIDQQKLYAITLKHDIHIHSHVHASVRARLHHI